MKAALVLLSLISAGSLFWFHHTFTSLAQNYDYEKYRFFFTMCQCFSIPVGCFFIFCAALIIWSALFDINKREPGPWDR